MNSEEILKQLEVGEDQDVEFKAAEAGLPRSLWERCRRLPIRREARWFLGLLKLTKD
ncbi:MAG: hypothetical protein JSR29_04375 [Nitrospira sp.]|nr:hypothetical protein [Nitrospira sp.]